jgi:hypothetical protein
MRELTVRVELPVAPAVALRLMYDDAGAFFARHHAVCSKDAEARVSRWQPDTRTRTVSFTKRLDMPAALAKVFGARGSAAPRPACGALVRLAVAGAPAAPRRWTHTAGRAPRRAVDALHLTHRVPRQATSPLWP